MTFIIDASMAAAWLLPEEFSTEAEDVIGSIAGPCPIPSLFWFEIRNILAMSERRGRIGLAMHWLEWSGSDVCRWKMPV